MASDCEICSGTDFEIVTDAKGRQFAKPCECRKNAQGGTKGSALDACRVPPRYEHCVMAEFVPGTPTQRAAREKAVSYCLTYPHLGPDEGLGLLFTGSNGVGKTHLAVAVLRELVDKKGVRGQFWDFHGLMREIRNSYNPETRTSELQVLEPVVEADVLVLDDLGAWKMTDWMNDTLFYILNSRYLARRPSVITTNFQDADMSHVQQADRNARTEFLVERIGQRLRSRLMEMCLVVPIDGPDQRRIRQEGHKYVI